MCLYPKLLLNPKYLPNRKNNYRPPKLHDKRVKWIPVGCQICMECMKQRGRQWKVRLMEEIQDKQIEEMTFVTLTFSTESLKKLTEDVWTANIKEGKAQVTGYDLDNAIATRAVRLFTERWRAKYGYAPRHWLTTELGHQNTEHVHLHGIIFARVQTKLPNKVGKLKTVEITKQEIAKLWNYGYVWTGTYVNEATVHYIIKYCTKVDQQHRAYKATVLCSKGIGRQYTTKPNARLNKYKIGGGTKETYTARNGAKMNLPMYYRNKIYTDTERENLWIEKIEKQERWVDGSRVSIKHGDTEYYSILNRARAKAARLGYGIATQDQKEYEQARRELLHGQRLAGRESGPDRQNMESSETTTPARKRTPKTNSKSEQVTKWILEMAQRPTGTIQTT